MRKLMLVLGAVSVSAGLGLALHDARADAQDTMSSHYGGLRDHCVGTRLESHAIRNKRGRAVGHTELWYSRISGGQNCVMTYNKAGSPFTRTYIWRLKRKGGLADAAAGDSGFYRYYAGGSFVNRSDGRCVTWGGTVGNFSWFSDPAGVHCG
jgi:hypothetical protein